MDGRCDLSSACALQECLSLALLHQLKHDALWRHLHMTSGRSTTVLHLPTIFFQLLGQLNCGISLHTLYVEKSDFITWFLK